jgi:hypothetical protein
MRPADDDQPTQLDASSVSGADLYLSFLSDEDRETFRRIAADPELRDEIRLLRLVLARLIHDLDGNHKLILPVLNALVRAINTQARVSDGGSDLERALLEAAEKVLDES